MCALHLDAFLGFFFFSISMPACWQQHHPSCQSSGLSIRSFFQQDGQAFQGIQVHSAFTQHPGRE